MITPILCKIHSLSGLILEEEIQSCEMQSAEGTFTVMAGHQPTLALLVPSVLQIRQTDDRLRAVYISGGYAEVSKGLTIFADEVIRSDELDEARAQHLREEAEHLLKEEADKGVPHFGKEAREERVHHLQALAKLKLVRQQGGRNTQV